MNISTKKKSGGVLFSDAFPLIFYRFYAMCYIINCINDYKKIYEKLYNKFYNKSYDKL